MNSYYDNENIIHGGEPGTDYEKVLLTLFVGIMIGIVLANFFMR